MYVGLGDTPASITPAAYTAAVNAAAAASGAFTCDLGYTYDPTSGVCVETNAFLGWLGTGNNAVYAGVGAIGFILLLSMMGRR
jgi:hypothetical protein